MALKIRVALMAILLTIGAAACSSNSKVVAKPPTSVVPEQLVTDAKGDGSVVIYHDLDVEAAQSLGNAFQAAYGVKAHMVRLGSASLVKRFETEKAAGRNTADVLVTSAGPEQLSWQKKGYLADISPTTARDFPADSKRGPGSYRFALGGTILMYNPTLMGKSDAPKSYTDLLDPKYAGKVALVAPWRSVVSLDWIWFMENVAKVPGFESKLKAVKPVVLNNSTDVVQAVVSGEVTAAWTVDRSCNQASSDGAPITCVFPPGQVQAYSRDVMAVSGAPHPRAAKLFVTWLLSQEGQTLFQKLVQQDSLRPDVPALKQEGRPAKIDWWVPDAAVIQKDQKGILARYQAALGG